jgi:hypothetical protein
MEENVVGRCTFDLRGEDDEVVVEVVAVLAELKVGAGGLEEVERMALLLERAEEDRMGALDLKVVQQHQRVATGLLLGLRRERSVHEEGTEEDDRQAHHRHAVRHLAPHFANRSITKFFSPNTAK